MKNLGNTVKYAKSMINPETFGMESGKKVNAKHDFGATFMTVYELQKGVKRAIKRGRKNKAKEGMYLAQAKAYQERLERKYEIT